MTADERVRPVSSTAVFKAMQDAGIFGQDERVRRVVLDIGADRVPMLYIERWADERILEVVPALTGVTVSWQDSRPREVTEASPTAAGTSSSA